MWREALRQARNRLVHLKTKRRSPFTGLKYLPFYTYSYILSDYCALESHFTNVNEMGKDTHEKSRPFYCIMFCLDMSCSWVISPWLTGFSRYRINGIHWLLGLFDLRLNKQPWPILRIYKRHTRTPKLQVQATHSDWSGQQKLRTLSQKVHLSLVAVVGGPGSHLYLTF